MRSRLTFALVLFYGVLIVGANWMTDHVGPIVLPTGTHLIPVPLGFGLAAPSGTYCAALVLIVRDILQRSGGRRWSLLVIIPGALVSAWTADPHIALASGTAFALSELLDFAVYTPLQRRHFTLAVTISVILGTLLDSFWFLTLAHIPLDAALPGLVLLRFEVLLVCLAVMPAIRRRVPIAASA